MNTAPNTPNNNTPFNTLTTPGAPAPRNKVFNIFYESALEAKTMYRDMYLNNGLSSPSEKVVERRANKDMLFPSFCAHLDNYPQIEQLVNIIREQTVDTVKIFDLAARNQPYVADIKYMGKPVFIDIPGVVTDVVDTEGRQQRSIMTLQVDKSISEGIEAWGRALSDMNEDMFAGILKGAEFGNINFFCVKVEGEGDVKIKATLPNFKGASVCHQFNFEKTATFFKDGKITSLASLRSMIGHHLTARTQLTAWFMKDEENQGFKVGFTLYLKALMNGKMN